MKRCLFVDDSPVIRRVARHILSGPEILFMEASSGAASLNICRIDVPDVVVIDTTLSDIDAIELVSRLRALDTSGRSKLVVSMNHLDIGFLTRAKRAGADGYMLKPFNRTQLLEAMQGFDLPVQACQMAQQPPRRARTFAGMQGSLSA